MTDLAIISYLPQPLTTKGWGRHHYLMMDPVIISYLPYKLQRSYNERI